MFTYNKITSESCKPVYYSTPVISSLFDINDSPSISCYII